MNKILYAGFLLSLSLAGCLKKQPTGTNQSSSLALQLQVAHWTLLKPGQENSLPRLGAPTQITHVEIFVTFETDTLARQGVFIAPGAEEFSASLEVLAGENRRVIVEAWDDVGGEGESAPGLILRGVQANVDIAPEMVQTVSLTLYPVPVSGRRVVLAAGPASGAPGSGNNLAPITLVSADSLSGIQFDLNFDPAVISPQGVAPAATLPWSNMENNIINSGQALRILMFDSNGRRLPVYADPAIIAHVDFRVNAEGATGSSPLTISNALVLDANRNQLEVAAVQDTFYVAGGK